MLLILALKTKILVKYKLKVGEYNEKNKIC